MLAKTRKLNRLKATSLAYRRRAPGNQTTQILYCNPFQVGVMNCGVTIE